MANDFRRERMSTHRRRRYYEVMFRMQSNSTKPILNAPINGLVRAGDTSPVSCENDLSLQVDGPPLLRFQVWCRSYSATIDRSPVGLRSWPCG
jgi:hypothetical protein